MRSTTARALTGEKKKRGGGKERDTSGERHAGGAALEVIQGREKKKTAKKSTLNV